MGTTLTAQTYERVSEMETPLVIARDLLDALAMIAEAMADEDDGVVVQRLAWLAREQVEKAQKLRGDLFRLNHPNRDHFVKNGDWEPLNVTSAAKVCAQ